MAQQVLAQAAGADRHHQVVDVPPVALFSRLMFSSEEVRMAKRRCGVIVLFHGVGGAAVVGSDTRRPVA